MHPGPTLNMVTGLMFMMMSKEGRDMEREKGEQEEKGSTSINPFTL